jgi:hypothetical protein
MRERGTNGTSNLPVKMHISSGEPPSSSGLPSRKKCTANTKPTEYKEYEKGKERNERKVIVEIRNETGVKGSESRHTG